MSVRMIPGFMKKRQVASPQLVDATFWLVNTAVVGRVLPLILPSIVFDASSVVEQIMNTSFALSGILGLGAVACLTANLWKTIHDTPA